MVSKLSILLPVYNQNVLALVAALLQEAQTLAIPFEILVYDDGSRPDIQNQNQPLRAWPNVQYQELPQNIGRSQIRFRMAQEAQYQHLLFLDNDVRPVHPDFLQRYLSTGGEDVNIGGIAYQDKPPKDFELRWKYGRKREEATAPLRQKNPYQRVFTSNMLVPKAVFLQYFPQNEVRGYGHEDTLFAWGLQQEQIKVAHIDNPVWHLGLEPADTYLLKTQQAIQNLVQLHRQYNLATDTKLFKAYRFLKKCRLEKLLQENNGWLFPLLKRNLVSRRPSLKLFDLYKLLLLERYLRK